ncbi:peptide-methionine (S)-S-oxide reductase MsrA [Mucilaginibacter ginkgonis]|uniref:Peptide methionine sulfoxide reductase MsrA n=1 Tax=Mucilaginibacter ginkgonis TaxID=2682091 RepID=A0A6I4HVZ6_9SPHI|nr:peptide-methionine (S)-S-oxide reductase MsrA [Mucilaginibacter ginkgonis]QQL51121.1 peptide-methionine (S)-S-oxide reductase MsrA [Mucilaginibacter ginkgonis]
MKRFAMYMLALVVLGSCANAQESASKNSFAAVPAPKAGEEVATFGGGCFWAMGEALNELKGVHSIVAGFAGGTKKNPTYEDVCTRTTGHAEVVQVYYDPKVISYATLAEAFFYAHNPTELNYQGPDEGTDYRSIAFYRTPKEKATLLETIAKVNASKHYNGKVVTQVEPFKVFYPAEKYHQGYYRLHGDSPYIQSVSVPKVLKMRAAMKQYLKPEFQK